MSLHLTLEYATTNLDAKNLSKPEAQLDRIERPFFVSKISSGSEKGKSVRWVIRNDVSMHRSASDHRWLDFGDVHLL